MKRLNKNQRNYLIIGLSIVVLLMAVGYAAFASRLNINGTSEVTSTWNVRITNITPIIPTGSTATDNNSSCDTSGTPKKCNDELLAEVSANLEKPGDSITYRIELTNLGSLNAVLTHIDYNPKSNQDIQFYINKDKDNNTINESGYRRLDENGILNPQSDTPNNKGYVYLTMVYKDYESQQTPTEQNKELTTTATFDFVQTSNTYVPGMSPTDLTTTLTEADGLYQDGNNYIFKGASPKNWIKFNGEDWRIMSIDSTGKMKIIRDEKLSATMAYDANDAHRKSGYCTSYDYCNVWAQDFTPAGDFSNNGTTGAVTGDSTLKTYLNTTYLSSISTNSDKIVQGTFNIGASGTYNDSNTIAQLQALEDDYKWTGTVGLATKSEYMNANTNSSCLTASALYSNYSTCTPTNYLSKDKSYGWWLLSPYSGSANIVLYARSNGSVAGNGAAGSVGVRPVLYLSSNITLTGTGEDAEHAFTIS